MNGTLLFRRSASIVLASFLLTVTACGVELSGLFQGDAAVDSAAPSDARQDDTPSDRTSDVRADVTGDASSTDGSSTDGSAIDVSTADRGGGDAIDVRVDGDASVDVPVDTDADADAGSDADVDGDAREASLDGDARDVANDPPRDAIAEDTAAEPRLDVPAEPPIDVVADAPPDASKDGADAGPPGTCTPPCNTFANISQTITRSVDPGPPPLMTGGNLVDGTYVAVDIVQYNNDNTMFTLSETSVIGGNIDAWVSSTNGQAEVRYTTTYTTTNNQLAFTFCCPSPGNLTILYTTNGTTISHVDPGNPNRIITYRRQ